MNNNSANQTELTLACTATRSATRPIASGAATGSHRRAQPARPERAAWWFARMHDAVDNASAWTGGPARAASRH